MMYHAASAIGGPPVKNELRLWSSIRNRGDVGIAPYGHALL